ncbi:MAG: cytochrome c biogenesis protein CcsA [Anaerolineae bacterium]
MSGVEGVAFDGAGLLWALAAVLGWLRREERWPAVAAWGLAAAGALLSLAGLTARGFAIAYWPLTNQFEFTHAFALALVLTALALDRPGCCQVLRLGLPIALLLWADAQWLLPASLRRPTYPMPALRSLWLPLHAGSAALAYAALTLSSLAILWAWSSGQEAWEAVGERVLQWGYVGLSASILLGAIWARQAWAQFWNWDPKEAWALGTWLLYTACWHTRGVPSWRGRRHAALHLLALGALWFTFLGVPWLARQVGLSSLHLY